MQHSIRFGVDSPVSRSKHCLSFSLLLPVSISFSLIISLSPSPFLFLSLRFCLCSYHAGLHRIVVPNRASFTPGHEINLSGSEEFSFEALTIIVTIIIVVWLIVPTTQTNLVVQRTIPVTGAIHQTSPSSSYAAAYASLVVTFFGDIPKPSEFYWRH